MFIVESSRREDTNGMEKRGSTPVAPRPPQLDALRSWFERDDFLSKTRRQKDAEIPVDYDV